VAVALIGSQVTAMAEQSVGPGCEEQDAEPVVTPEAVAAVAAGRHRRHRFPARGHVVKVLYGEEERAAVEVAAELAGLRPSGYVAAAALVMAQQVQEPTGPGEGGGAGGPARRRVPGSLSSPEDRELLAELIQARLALRRYGTNVNQAAAVLNSGGQVPVWLEQAVAGGDRAVARVDAAAAAVARRLG